MKNNNKVTGCMRELESKDKKTMSESINEQKIAELKNYSTKEMDTLLEHILSGLGSILNATDTDKEIAAVAELKKSITENKDSRSEEHTSELQSPDHLVC